MSLITKTNFHDPNKLFFRDYSPVDTFYQELIDTHSDLTDEQSEIVNAKLVLLLSNHIGNLSILKEAMQIARRDTI